VRTVTAPHAATRLVTFAGRTLRRIDGARLAIGTDRSDMLTVTAPAGTPDADVQRMAREHYGAISGWVQRGEAVDAWRPLAKEFVSGEGFLLKGRSARLRWVAGHGAGASFIRDGFGWWLAVDASMCGDDVATRQAVIDCYGRHSVKAVLASAELFAKRAGVRRPLAGRATDRDRVWVATRAGKSGLTFEAHWALAQFPLTTVDYLVARALTARPDVSTSLESLVPCPWQPRRRFHEEAANVWEGDL
jgi:predicted metal-dependent hydrolase